MAAKQIDKEIMDEVYARFIGARMRTQNTGTTQQSLPLGSEYVNEVIGDGFPFGSVTYVRGRWGSGRFSVILNTVAYNLHNADRPIKVLFSLEEKDIYSTAYRLASIIANVSSYADHKISADDFFKKMKAKYAK